MDSTELNDMHNELVAMERTLYIENKNHDLLERVRSLIEVTKECLRMYEYHEERDAKVEELEDRVAELEQYEGECDSLRSEVESLEAEVASLEDQLEGAQNAGE